MMPNTLNIYLYIYLIFAYPCLHHPRTQHVVGRTASAWNIWKRGKKELMVVILVVFGMNVKTVQNFSHFKCFIQISEHKLLHCGEYR